MTTANNRGAQYRTLIQTKLTLKFSLGPEFLLTTVQVSVYNAITVRMSHLLINLLQNNKLIILWETTSIRLDYLPSSTTLCFLFIEYQKSIAKFSQLCHSV